MAFTAWGLNNNPSDYPYSTLVFRSTYINNGNDYDTLTGKFTCEIPGVYHFSVTLTKYYKKFRSTKSYLRINGKRKLCLHWQSYYDEKNMFEATPFTQSGTFHLNDFDVVDVFGTPTCFYGQAASIFTGFLVTPD